MSKKPKTFLTDRQIEVLKMRKQGLTQEEVAGHLETSRANVSILERRAYENIERAKATLETTKQLEIPTSVTIMPETIVTDIPRLVLDKADELGIKIRGSCIDILETIRLRARRKIRGHHVKAPIAVEIMPDGDFSVR